jgi:hypothetical protein
VGGCGKEERGWWWKEDERLMNGAPSRQSVAEAPQASCGKARAEGSRCFRVKATMTTDYCLPPDRFKATPPSPFASPHLLIETCQASIHPSVELFFIKTQSTHDNHMKVYQ